MRGKWTGAMEDSPLSLERCDRWRHHWKRGGGALAECVANWRDICRCFVVIRWNRWQVTERAGEFVRWVAGGNVCVERLSLSCQLEKAETGAYPEPEVAVR
jgi:hypothetical protein